MNLVVDDGHIDDVKQYLMEQCDNLDSFVSSYVKTMNMVVETGIMEGTTAEAVKSFLNQVELDIKSKEVSPDLLKDQIERFCANFIARIDKADKELY